MSDEQGEIRQKARDIANESIEKSDEIVEGAKQALGGDVPGGVTNILKAASDIATGATEKGIGIAQDVLNKMKERTESETEGETASETESETESE